MKYPARFEPDPKAGGFVITFRDIPEAVTQGDDDAEAMEMAEDALISSIEFYLEQKRQIPAPSTPLSGERLVPIPAITAAKVLLLNEMIAQGIGPSELARKMGTIPQNVNRLIDVRHTSKLESIELAVSALGKHLELSIV
ncbi:type II toxin-antitoxin system HicB family antitoxin [Pseudoduganella violacea]|uniref:Antitoxin HicB n=1 Tax=Pseudoduganella violacea TaxID=1715466 RepID=A0A7W5BA31_9BURK|nr:type II toxin-antitoxin system HicB family antitoxin [Pseudoduganella violacea]MBB3119352.1 antitoxin HicB [Pseudoduganella violacea]